MSTRPVRAVSKGTQAVPTLADEGLIVTDMSLETIAMDDGAVWILRTSADEGGHSIEQGVVIPKEVRDALGSGNPADLPATKLRFRIGAYGYNCRAFVMRPGNGATHEPMLALHLQRDSSVTDAVRLLAAQFNLTDREEEALKAIAVGLTSKEAAERMNISPNTVKSFMRLIMIKMGVASRAGIVGKLLEYSTSNYSGPGT